MTAIRPEDVCAAACADVFRNDGEVLAQAFGAIPRLGVGLAKLTTNPSLLITDGEAMLVSEPLPLGTELSEARVEGWMPFRRVFDVVWSGRRHVMMGTTQIDAHGNTNISAIGDWHRPKVQLLGARGAPGNTVNNAVSYWVPAHNTRVFREKVDVVSGVGTDADPAALRYLDLRRVVTGLGVLDFGGKGGRMRLISVHPWTDVAAVRSATGFDLESAPDLCETRGPAPEELELIERVLDPRGLRLGQVDT